jgi:hypothetical protein
MSFNHVQAQGESEVRLDGIANDLSRETVGITGMMNLHPSHVPLSSHPPVNLKVPFHGTLREVLSLMFIQVLAVLGPKDIGVQLRQPSPPLGRHLEMPDCRGDLS